MQSDLGLQLVRQQVKRLLVVEGLLRQPQIVEPANDPVVQLIWDVAQSHVRLDRVELSCSGTKVKVKVDIT